MEKKLTKATYLFYGLGVAYFMLDQVFNQWVKYFYIPSESAITNYGMRAIIPAGYLAFAFVIMRLVDAIADPLVGYLSDNSEAKIGRRSFYMLIGIIPLSISVVLFFYPIQSSNIVTMLYIALVGSIYFTAYTLVGGPYNALIPDLASNKDERLALSTVQSVFRLVFTAIPLILSPIIIGKIYDKFDLSYPNAMRVVIIMFAVLSAILVLISIFGLNEKKKGKIFSKDKREPIMVYLKYLNNKEIYLYFAGFFMFFTGFNIIRNSVIYYVVSVLGLTEKASFLPTAILFVASAVFFPITQKLCKKYDYRKVMLGDLLMIILGTIILITIGPKFTMFYYLGFIIVGIGVSGAAFIFPPAMLSEITNSLYEKHGVSIEGIMFGIQGLFLKLALLVELVVTTLLITMGSVNGGATKLGVIVTLIIAIIFLTISFICYYLKKEI